MTGTDDRLDEIEARADAATPGPWEAHELEAAEYCVLRVSEGDDDYGDDVCSAGSMTDAQFIAAAREDVPWLAEQLRDARAEVERLTHLGAVHHADVGEWRAERDTWRDRALKAEAERDGWRREAITRRRTLVNVVRGLQLRAGRLQLALNEARRTDDQRTASDASVCGNAIEGVLGARLVCARLAGHTGEHTDGVGTHWFLAKDGNTAAIYPDGTVVGARGVE